MTDGHADLNCILDVLISQVETKNISSTTGNPGRLDVPDRSQRGRLPS